MVAVAHIACPKCSRVFYIHKDLSRTDFQPRCPYCKHDFKQEESPDIWDARERRGWQAVKKG